jgi:S-formylglutathione hydrolase FrmB
LLRLNLPQLFRALVIAVSLAAPHVADAQRWTGGVTHVDTVQAPSLRGNLIGDPAWREATVYLPPGYSTNRTKRYPVVYLLHGFAGDHRQFIRGSNLQNLNLRISLDSLIGAGAAKEMIVVMPNAKNFFDGSFFTNSPVTGNWEEFIVRDLIAHVEKKYRAIRNRSGRGLAGWSMGGFGAIRIGMRHADRFAAVYALSPCCLAMNSLTAPWRAEGWRSAIRLTERTDYKKAGFNANLLYAIAAAYSPNTAKPPFFADLPLRLEGDSLIPLPEILAKWTNGPLAMVDAHLDALRKLELAFDAGDADGLLDIPVNVRALDSLLTARNVPHTAEVYSGNHGSRIRSRFESKVFPFFSRVLH